ncbi:hypothetical protein FQN50_000624 [Emmonsiellopsis sp. PD_5]|nr:hypothetical protein FQN50_000624 [Emmonsiellopsis sp. PD_5]
MLNISRTRRSRNIKNTIVNIGRSIPSASRLGSTAIKLLLDSKFPKDPSLNLVHLRRFAKPEFIPDHLKRENSASPPPSQEGSKPPPPRSIYILIPPPLPEPSVLETLLAPYAPIPPPPSPLATDSSFTTTDHTPGPNPDQPQPQPAPVPPPTIRIQSTRIPLYPPTTYEESTRWSSTLWPTIYNPAAQSLSHSPRGPLLFNALTSVNQVAGRYLALARQVALEAKQSGRGRAIGAVVVDPALAGEEEFLGVVAVAGDARYWRRGDDDQVSRGSAMMEEDHEKEGKGYNPDNEGQPDQHALMRAIALVAYKRLNTSDSPTVTPSVLMSRASTPFEPESGPAQTAGGFETTDADNTIPTPKKLKLSPESEREEPAAEAESEPTTPHPPPTPLESHFLSLPNLQSRTQGGYLCTGLDIYLTHEPCVCCSMGMLLSRFRAVVVLQPTGREDAALDPEVGYGLHWRRELNWRAVGFRFLLGEGEKDAEGLERGVFHA